jgi:hypothetical protein
MGQAKGTLLQFASKCSTGSVKHDVRRVGVRGNVNERREDVVELKLVAWSNALRGVRKLEVEPGSVLFHELYMQKHYPL